MTIRKTLTYTIINACLILLGVFIGFKFTWAQGLYQLWGIVAVALVFYGSIALSYIATKAILLENFDSNQWKVFTEKPAKTQDRLFAFTCFSLLLVIISSAAYLYFGSVKKHERHHLSSFGQTQKVLIKYIDPFRGILWAHFDYQLNGKQFNNKLDAREFKDGDSVLIIFSTKNPDILKWADEFDSIQE